ncbi:ABC transporter permease [Clostridium intestinale]|uniref:ABC transporter permease n=1 Tax=Clostridium intestinale TaxID=36845 RepID=UPI0028E6BEBF|nr:ABC transporter permease [Clostridium intestinale]
MLQLIKIFIKNDIKDKLVIAVIVFLTSILLTFNAIGIHDGKNNILEANMGNINHKKTLIINNKNEKDFNDMLKIINEQSINTQVSIDGIENIHKVNNKISKIQNISFVNFQINPEWMPEVLFGRNFTVEDLENNSKVAVIGEGVYRDEYSDINNAYIEINNERYKIIGVVGDYRTSATYISTIFLPLNEIKANILNISNVKVTFFKNNEKPQNELEEVQNKLNEKHIENFEDNTPQIMDEDYIGRYVMLIIASIIISFFNIILFYNYIINKNKKIISINLVLGSNYILTSIISFIEYSIISLIATCFGMIVCYTITNVFKDVIYNYLFISNIGLNYLEIIIPILLIIILNLLISIYQAYKISKLDLSEQLKID